MTQKDDTSNPLQRRTLLATTAALAATAGCAGIPGETDDESTDEQSGDGTPVTDDQGSADETGADGGSETDAQFEVELEIPEHVVVLEEPRARGVSMDDVIPEDDIPDPLHDALLDAQDGGFETDDPPEELLAAIDELRTYGYSHQFNPYVRLDGREYVMEVGMPEFVARGEPTEDHDTARTVSFEEMDEDLEDFRGPLTSETSHDPYDEYRASVVPAAVEDFLETYDYIQDPQNVLKIETEWIDPGPPYSISVRELTEDDRWRRPVTDLGSVSDDVAAVLSDAVSDGVRSKENPLDVISYRTDDVPLGNSVLDGETLFRESGTVYEVVTIASPTPDQTPIDVEVEADHEGDTPQFTLTAEATELPDGVDSVTLNSAGAVPTLLWVERNDSVELLDSDINERIEWETDDDGENRWVDNHDEVLLSPDEGSRSSVSATYRLPDDATETIEALGGIGATWPSEGPTQERVSGGFPLTVVITLAE